MKKILVIVLSLILCFGLSGCGGEEEKIESPLSKANIAKMYESKDFEKYLNAVIENLPIQVNGSANIQNIEDAYSGFISDYSITAAGQLDFSVKSVSDFTPVEDQYVLVSGIITDVITYTYENGTTTQVPFLEVYAISEDSSYTVYPAEDTIDLNCDLEKKNFKVTLQKIEQSKNSTRVYFSLENKSDKEIWILASSPEIKQNANTYAKTEYSYATDTLKTEVPAGETREGFLSFERIKDIRGDFTIQFDVSNDEDGGGKLAAFKFSVQEGIATAAQSKSSSQPPATITQFSSGMYKVGTDIPAGEYKLTTTSTYGGYYCVYSSPPGANEEIVSNDNFDNNAYIAVSDGQYLELSRCKAEKTD